MCGLVILWRVVVQPSNMTSHVHICTAGPAYMRTWSEQKTNHHFPFVYVGQTSRVEIIIAHDRAEAHAELPVYRNVRA